MGKTRQFLSTYLFSSKNMVSPIINNDEGHTRKIEDGVSSLQLFFFNRKADSKIELHAFKSRGNVVVVLKEIQAFWCFLLIVIPRARYQNNMC